MFMYNIVLVTLFSLSEGASLRPRSSRMIRASKWSIGTETMDRNLTIYNNYESFLEPLGEACVCAGRGETQPRCALNDCGTVLNLLKTLNYTCTHMHTHTGAKRARLQGGWHRCDPNGTAAATGEYNWGWLDQAVFGIHEKGIKPWIELSYGNAAYPGGELSH